MAAGVEGALEAGRREGEEGLAEEASVVADEVAVIEGEDGVGSVGVVQAVEAVDGAASLGRLPSLDLLGCLLLSVKCLWSQCAQPQATAVNTRGPCTIQSRIFVCAIMLAH